MYDKNHYNIVISLQLIKINEKNKNKNYTVQPKYIQFLFVNYTSIKWGGKNWDEKGLGSNISASALNVVS